MEVPWVAAGKGLQLVPMHLLDQVVCMSEKGVPCIGKKNTLSLGLKPFESTSFYTIRVCNFDTGTEYVLSYDPITFISSFELPTASVEFRSRLEVEKIEDTFFSFRLLDPPRYLRHSNSILRFDEKKEGPQFFFDSVWILRPTPHRIRPIPDLRVSWPTLTLRGVLGPRSDAVIQALMDVATTQLHSHRRSRTDTPVYDLQGAGGATMSEATRALDFRPPGTHEYSDKLRKRVEAASTIRRRGGVDRFGKFSDDAEVGMIELDWYVRRAIETNDYLRDEREKTFFIGFIELIHQPPGSVIAPHCDGYNDCDFAANFALQGPADVTVEKKRFRLHPGDCYVFRPHQQLHGVDAPLDTVFGRYIVSIRYFFIN